MKGAKELRHRLYIKMDLFSDMFNSHCGYNTLKGNIYVIGVFIIYAVLTSFLGVTVQMLITLFLLAIIFDFLRWTYKQ